MVPLHHFHKITYRRLRKLRPPESLKNVVGLDTEAYTHGETFMFCTSTGDIIAPDSFIDTAFTSYAPCNFVTWNLKYESGAILKLFPVEVIKTLQQKHRVIFEYRGRKLDVMYVPHKRLRIHHIAFAGKSINFWDISPFYGRCHLDKAATDYLNDSKIKTDVTLFTRNYVAAHYQEIADYCIHDAKLTEQLAKLWINNFEKTGIAVSSLYSEASISFAYITSKTDIPTPWEFWEYNKKLLQLAFESYEGGKFEITARGSFTGYEYDISSAYPYEISRLLDIRGSRVVYSTRYERDAAYAFLRCRIVANDPSVHLPCGIFHKLRLYPMGEYYLTITKQEYDYIRTELPQVKITILDGAWLIVSRYSYPYKNIFNDLYRLKTEWKNKDRLRSNNYKIIMNGYYGKMAQAILIEDGSYRAGPGWNPVYASVITANTRIAVTRLQNLFDRNCLAVHTDSVITTRPLPDRYLGKGLGQFELVEQGAGVLVACGIYELNGQCALKGFKKYSVTSILSENPGETKIKLTIKKHAQSWLQAMAQNHDVDDINRFSDIQKILTLNCDTKRNWPNDMTSTDLLNSLQYSAPLSYHQDFPPEYWT